MGASEAPEPVPLEELEALGGAPSPEEEPKSGQGGGSKTTRRKRKGFGMGHIAFKGVLPCQLLERGVDY